MFHCQRGHMSVYSYRMKEVINQHRYQMHCWALNVVYTRRGKSLLCVLDSKTFLVSGWVKAVVR